MKWIIGIALILFNLQNAYAERECVIDLNLSIFSANGKHETSYPQDYSRIIIMEDSWEKCYKTALLMTDESVTPIEKQYSTDFAGYANYRQKSLLMYVAWSYNDSLTPETSTSSGQLNKFTKEFNSAPIKGNAKFTPDGSLY